MTTSATTVGSGITITAGTQITLGVLRSDDNDAVFHVGTSNTALFSGQCGQITPFVATPGGSGFYYINVDVTVGGAVEIC